MIPSHGRRGRPWRRLRAQVLTEEPQCYLCGRPSTCVDHVWPLSLYPHLAHDRQNLRGCCRRCNGRKNNHLPGRHRHTTTTTNPHVSALRW